MPNFPDLPTETQLMIFDEYYADRLGADPWIVDIKFVQSGSTSSPTEKRISREFFSTMPRFDPLPLVNRDLAALARVSFDQAVTGYVGKIRVSFPSEGQDPSAVIEVIDSMSNLKLRTVLLRETTGLFFFFAHDEDVEKASRDYSQQQFEEKFRSLQTIIGYGPLRPNPQMPWVFQAERQAAIASKISNA